MDLAGVVRWRHSGPDVHDAQDQVGGYRRSMPYFVGHRERGRVPACSRHHPWRLDGQQRPRRVHQAEPVRLSLQGLRLRPCAGFRGAGQRHLHVDDGHGQPHAARDVPAGEEQHPLVEESGRLRLGSPPLPGVHGCGTILEHVRAADHPLRGAGQAAGVGRPDSGGIAEALRRLRGAGGGGAPDFLRGAHRLGAHLLRTPASSPLCPRPPA
mmetsp:Transcript_111355/g.319937  ORF Transcript_111355/g.319937 Transcript_111355/m.319937 type:complete len:211 (-) Transcript_111355:42-674(-)